jgi:maltose O-acetyltransferase
MKKVERPARRLAGIVCAAYFKTRFGSRIQGSSFILRKAGLVRISRGASVSIGRNSFIERGARIVVKSTLSIGENVYIGKNVTIVAFSPLVIESETLIGENVSIHTENHGPYFAREQFSSSPILIGTRVWLGAGAVVTSGVTIGSGVTVGANSVVTKSFPENCLIAGVPAKLIKKYEEQS